MNLFQHVITAARLFPEQPAIVFGPQRMSYAELERRSAAAADVLRDLGVGRGDRVGLLLANVPAFPVWYYATLRLGAVAVSISTRLAAEEVAYIVSDCGAEVLVTDESRERLLEQGSPACLRQVVPVSEDAARCRGEAWPSSDAGEAPCVASQPDDPAVILYTSGTTGFPKGATLSHQNIRATVHAFHHLCQMQPQDRLLLAVPLFHCYGQNALLNSGLAIGATIILQRRFDLNESRQLIAEHRVNRLFGVPTTFQLLLECCTPEDLASIEYCFSAAATLPVQVAERWQKTFGMPIFEGYGLTETAPFASYNHRLRHVPGSIGAPVDLVEMKIVDPETGRECGPGEPGEIAIRGPNVMLGYWNRPEETAEAVRDGWFHSGDIGRVDEQGYFYIVDRLKDMISIGGMKVFPAEVERVLLDHEGVAEAAVIGLPDDVMGEKVAAILVPRPKSAPTVDAILKHCRQRLGAFKSPQRIELVESLPRNPAGKVLKTKLREQWGAAPPGDGRGRPPQPQATRDASAASRSSDPADPADATEQPGPDRAELPPVRLSAAELAAAQGAGEPEKDGLPNATGVAEPGYFDLATAVAVDHAARSAAPSPLADRLAREHRNGRQRVVVSLIQRHVQELASLDTPPEPDSMLLDAGLDSLMIVELRDRLQQQVGHRLALSATIVFDQPRISDLAAYLVESLEAPAPDAKPSVLSSAPSDRTAAPATHSASASDPQPGREIQAMSEQEALRELQRELNDGDA